MYRRWKYLGFPTFRLLLTFLRWVSIPDTTLLEWLKISRTSMGPFEGEDTSPSGGFLRPWIPEPKTSPHWVSIPQTASHPILPANLLVTELPSTQELERSGAFTRKQVEQESIKALSYHTSLGSGKPRFDLSGLLSSCVASYMLLNLSELQSPPLCIPAFQHGREA